MKTTFDLSPLFRSTIGFERLANMIEKAERVSQIDSWPPYDIVKSGNDEYRITLAVAGFAQSDLTITQEPNLLIITGNKAADDQIQYLHRGIAGRAFERRFELADHVKIAGARLENGLLTIDLQREIPEALKPRKIEIAMGTSLPRSETRQIEGKQAA